MIEDLPPPLTQHYELKRTLSPRESTKTTKSAPKKRSARKKLILPKEFDEEEGTSKSAPLPQTPKIPAVLLEDPSKNVIPKFKEWIDLQEKSAYNTLKKIQKERAKRQREEEELSKAKEPELEKDKLVHRDKRTNKPNQDCNNEARRTAGIK